MGQPVESIVILSSQQIQMRNRYFSPESKNSGLHLNASSSNRLRWVGSTAKLSTYNASLLDDYEKKIGNYTYYTNKEIGSGYSSKVYKAYSSQDNEEYAIKVIELKKYSPSSLQMLESEIQILKVLDHPNVIRCYDIYKTHTHCYIVMEYCANGDLLGYLTRRGKLQETVAVQIMSEVIEGVKYLLGCGILHRDLKPANILNNKKNWKIADFGFAIFSDAQIKTRYNVGTPLYMPPQALSKNVYSPQSDIFSIGIILYELITGVTPWECKSQKELIKKMASIPFNIPQKHNVTSHMKVILQNLCSIELEKRCTKQQFNSLKLKKYITENPQESRKMMLSASKRSSNGNQSEAGHEELVKSTSTGKILLHGNSANIMKPKATLRTQDTMSKEIHRIQTKNNHILINQLHYCRFIYYMTKNIQYFLVSQKNKNKITLILYKHLQKLIKNLSDNTSNWFCLKNWDNFKESKKYYTTLQTMKEYSVRYQKEYLNFLKNAEITIIRQINKDLCELSTPDAFTVNFYKNMLDSLSPIIRQFNHNLTLAINKSEAEINVDIKGNIQGLKSLYQYYKLIKMSMEQFQNYQSFEKSSDIKVQIDYKMANNVTIQEFLELRKSLKFI